MTPSSRDRRGPLLLLAALSAVAFAGCGGTTPSSSSLPAGATPTTPSTPATSPSASTTPTAGPATTAAPLSGSPTASSARVQLVKVVKYGIAFELPKSWTTLDAHEVLKGGGTRPNPYLDDLAKKLGTTPQRLTQQFSTVVQTMSVSGQGAVDGVLDNVNSIGQTGDLNDEQLKLQFATVGAKLQAPVHASSRAGDVTEIAYVLHTRTAGAPAVHGLTIHGVALAVHTGGSTVLIGVTSSAVDRASRIADMVLRSLQKTPNPEL